MSRWSPTGAPLNAVKRFWPFNPMPQARWIATETRLACGIGLNKLVFLPE